MRLFKEDLKRTGLVISIGLFLQFFYHYISPVLLPWSLDAVPFFTALLEVGYSIGKTDFLEKACRDKKASLFCLAAGTVFVLTALWNGSANLSIGEYGKSMIIDLYNAVTASFLIMLLCYRAECGGRRSYLPRILYKPGKYTLTILCYHLFVFLFLQSGIAVLCEMAGMREDSVVPVLLRFGMIPVTIAGISCAGSILNRIRERKRNAQGMKRSIFKQ
jgi:fucose 4-O-acetylase-like acetyltransferase